MVYYYLDLETYGEGPEPDPEKDEIITITFCAINPRTGKPTQEPIILRAWQSSEQRIVQELARRMVITKPFDFVPVGFNVLFDLWFLKTKLRQHARIELGDRFYLERPYVDLKQVMVFGLGRFKGVRLSPEGNPVQDWYRYQDYDSIEQHLLSKLERFSKEWAKWRERLG